MSNTSLANVAELFSGQANRRYLEVELPARGVTVRIQSLLAGEASRFQSALISPKSRRIIQGRFEDATARLIVLCLVNANGDCILDKTHVGMIVNDWDNADVAYLGDICMAHCGMDPAEFEGLAKNSAGISFDGKKSESPEASAE